MNDTTIHPKNITVTKSQNELVLQHLQQGKSITGMQALILYGIMHLPKRINLLKEQGHNITGQYITVTKANGTTAYVKQYAITNSSFDVPLIAEHQVAFAKTI